MNIGIVTAWFERGAGYVSRQYRQVLQQDHSVYIYARAGDERIGDPVWDDKLVTWGKRSHLPVPSAIDRKDFEAWLTTKNIDIVFFNEQQWWEPLSWCLELGIRTGAYVDYYTEETIPFFACYDFLICNTRRHYSAFAWHPNVHYIPWGTDIELFCPRSFEPVNSEKITFFHSCGYSPNRKGTDFIIKALSQMEKPAILIIHSQVDLHQVLSTCSNLISELENQGHLKIINQTVTAPGLYYLGDVYVGPSRLEGIGLPLVESQACGLPLVTCDFPPMNEFVAQGISTKVKVDRLWSRKDGYYWPQCSPDIHSLSQALDHYALNFDKIKTLKLETRQYAENHFDWSINANSLSEIFSKVQLRQSKEAIMQKTLKFERKRQGIIYRFARKYPLIWQLYKQTRND